LMAAVAALAAYSICVRSIPLYSTADDDGDFYSVTLVFRQTTG
jgi:hypothetical protein